MLGHGLACFRHAPGLDRAYDFTVRHRADLALSGDDVQALNIFQREAELIEYPLIPREFSQTEVEELVVLEELGRFEVEGVFGGDNVPERLHFVRRRPGDCLFNVEALQDFPILVDLNNVAHRDGRQNISLVANALDPFFLGKEVARFPDRSPGSLALAGKVHFGEEVAGAHTAFKDPLFQEAVDAVDFALLFEWLLNGAHKSRLSPLREIERGELAGNVRSAYGQYTDIVNTIDFCIHFIYFH